MRTSQGYGSDHCSSTTRDKIAVAQTAERGFQWRGDQVGYSGAHKRHRAALPMECNCCGATSGRLDVALRHDAPPDRLVWSPQRERYYSVSTEDYLRLCRSCHLCYDRGLACRHAMARS